MNWNYRYQQRSNKLVISLDMAIERGLTYGTKRIDPPK
jgi:hypothetical protein